jgi:hypothetical protein
MSDQKEDELLRDLKMVSESLASILNRVFKIYGATGVVLPVPPKPKLEVVAKVSYAALLIAEAVDQFPKIRSS